MDVKNSQKELIREYLLQNISIKELSDDFDIFDAGIVNSLFAIQLMTYMEKVFHIKITMEDLEMTNFSSINAITQFLSKKIDV